MSDENIIFKLVNCIACKKNQELVLKQEHTRYYDFVCSKCEKD